MLTAKSPAKAKVPAPLVLFYFVLVPLLVLVLVLLLLLPAVILRAAPTVRGAVEAGGGDNTAAATSPFAAMPVGTVLDCYFEQETDQIHCWIGANPDALFYSFKWGALAKDAPHGVFRLFAVEGKDLVTPITGYVDGQNIKVQLVSSSGSGEG